VSGNYTAAGEIHSFWGDMSDFEDADLSACCIASPITALILAYYQHRKGTSVGGKRHVDDDVISETEDRDNKSEDGRTAPVTSPPEPDQYPAVSTLPRSAVAAQ
jgi:hypothetical protein